NLTLGTRHLQGNLPGRLMVRHAPVSSTVTNAAKIDIKSLRFDELQEKLNQLQAPSYRAGQLTDWLYKKRARSFDEMTDLPQSLRAQLAAQFSFDKIDVVRLLGSSDTTQKFVFRRRLAAPTVANFARAAWMVSRVICARTKS